MRDRNLLRVKVQAIPRVKRAALGFWICAGIYNWCGNPVIFTRSSVPLLESLKSNAHLIIDARKRKNLTHLQSILLFKDSSGTINALPRRRQTGTLHARSRTKAKSRSNLSPAQEVCFFRVNPDRETQEHAAAL